MSDSTGTLATALLKAQSEMPAVEPDQTNGHFGNKFVSLGHLIAKTRPVLNKHGIAVSQLPSRAEDGSPTLTTILMHESGESLESVAPLLLAKNDPQGQGSAITYMRRYALASALGISDQEDDDGNAGSKGQPEPPPSEPEVERITPDEVEAIYKHFEASDKTADQLKTKLGGLKVEEKLTSVKQGIGLLTPENAVTLDAWLGEQAP